MFLMNELDNYLTSQPFCKIKIMQFYRGKPRLVKVCPTTRLDNQFCFFPFDLYKNAN